MPLSRRQKTICFILGISVVVLGFPFIYWSLGPSAEARTSCEQGSSCTAAPSVFTVPSFWVGATLVLAGAGLLGVAGFRKVDGDLRWMQYSDQEVADGAGEPLRPI